MGACAPWPQHRTATAAPLLRCGNYHNRALHQVQILLIDLTGQTVAFSIVARGLITATLCSVVLYNRVAQQATITGEQLHSDSRLPAQWSN